MAVRPFGLMKSDERVARPPGDCLYFLRDVPSLTDNSDFFLPFDAIASILSHLPCRLHTPHFTVRKNRTVDVFRGRELDQEWPFPLALGGRLRLCW
jgi:hypothetical protein